MTDSWPPRWTGSNFKTGVTSRVERRTKRAGEKTAEEKNKKKVRLRDKRCRFPLCGCKRLKIMAHVSHQRHKGSGGNPAGDRSQPSGMIYVCACRHRENVISIDRGTLRWRELEKGKGADGYIAWDIRRDELPSHLREGRAEWVEIAREWRGGELMPLAGHQLAILQWLAKMEV